MGKWGCEPVRAQNEVRRSGHPRCHVAGPDVTVGSLGGAPEPRSVSLNSPAGLCTTGDVQRRHLPVPARWLHGASPAIPTSAPCSALTCCALLCRRIRTRSTALPT